MQTNDRHTAPVRVLRSAGGTTILFQMDDPEGRQAGGQFFHRSIKKPPPKISRAEARARFVELCGSEDLALIIEEKDPGFPWENS